VCDMGKALRQGIQRRYAASKLLAWAAEAALRQIS
jgi:hypothetical protein